MPLRNLRLRTARMFGDIRGNARPILLFEPMWVIPYSMYTVYTSLYMRALGLSAKEIGILASVGFASIMLCSAAAGFITDRLGRRRTTLIFDLIGWTVPVLVWAMARDFWWFLAAALINGFQAIPGTSWSCWLVEDSEPDQKLSIFTVLQMAGPLGGFVTPLAGLVIRGLGIVPGTRLLYAFAFVCMTAMFFGRNHFTTESKVGESRRTATHGHTLVDSLADYLESLRVLLGNRTAVGFLLLNAVLAFRDSLTAPFYQMFQVDGLRLSQSVIAVFPAAGGVATMAVLLIVLPLLKGKVERVGLPLGLGLSAVSLAALIWAPRGSVAVVALSALLGAAAGAILTPAFNTGWYETLGDRERAKVVAAAMLVWGLARLPGGLIGGALYTVGPAWPFYASLALLVFSLPLLWLIGPENTAGSTPRHREAGRSI